MSTGFNASTEFWKTAPDVESTAWNIHGLRHVVTPSLRYRWTFWSTERSDDLVHYDGVERFDELHTLVPGVQNRYETKRMTPYGPTTVTFLDVDMEQAFVFENRREHTDTLGDFALDAKYRPDLERYLLRHSQIRLNTDVDWADGNVDSFGFEFATEPGPDLFARAAYSYARRGNTDPTLALDGFTPSSRNRDLNSVTFELARRLTRLWDVAVLQQFDLEDDESAETSLVLRRHTADWVFELELGLPSSGLGSGVGFSITPAAFFRRSERRRFQSALSDGYDLTPVFEEPLFVSGPALQ
jgi:hypothetical protein